MVTVLSSEAAHIVHTHLPNQPLIKFNIYLRMMRDNAQRNVIRDIICHVVRWRKEVP